MMSSFLAKWADETNKPSGGGGGGHNHLQMPKKTIDQNRFAEGGGDSPWICQLQNAFDKKKNP